MSIDLNTITIILSVFALGFWLDRRINARINELKQDLLREMDQRFGAQSLQIASIQATITTMQADIVELQKGQARIEGAMEVMKDLFERAMFSTSART